MDRMPTFSPRFMPLLVSSKSRRFENARNGGTASASRGKRRMPPAKRVKAAPPKSKLSHRRTKPPDAASHTPSSRTPSELVIITGFSGSGKASVLRVLEDLGYYSVDNLPIELIPTFAELVRDSGSIRRAALVIDVREGTALRKLPELYARIKSSVKTKLLFLEADEDTLMRRFSETR